MSSENNEDENNKTDGKIAGFTENRQFTFNQNLQVSKLQFRNLEIEKMLKDNENPAKILNKIKEYEEKYIYTNKEIARLNNYKGLCYRHLNEHNKALSFFDKSILLDEGFTAPLFNKATTFHYYLKLYSEAEKYYLEYILLEPDELSAKLYLAHLYYDIKNYLLAIKYFEQSLTQINTSDSYNDFMCYGCSLYYINKKEEAIKVFEKALALSENNVQALDNLYLIYIDKKNYKKANKYLNQLLEKEPNNYLYNIRKANVYSVINNTELVQHLEKAILIDRNRYEAYLGLARYYKDIEDNTLSENNYIALLNLDIKDETILLEMAEFFKSIKNYEKAFETYKKIIEYNIKNYDAFVAITEIATLGQIYINEVQDLLMKQIENNNYPEHMYSLIAGLLFLGKKDIEEAEKYCFYALNKNDKYIVAYELLVEIYKKQNNFQKMKEIKKVISDLNSETKNYENN